MANYRTSRILPTVLTIIVIVIAIAGLVALARLLFTGSSSTAVTEFQAQQQGLLNTDDGRAVSMTVRGPIVADEDFRSYQVIISPTERKFTAYTGYLDVITDQQVLSNNTAAYDQFVHALNKANMVAGTPFTGDKNNVLGVCATGKVYEYRTMSGGEDQTMLWTSTCSGSPGSLKASSTQLSRLFLSQIPDGSNIEANLKI
ncbi:hypothetical protein BGO17_03845 [Candidatus Saccharibacteria bacterium 49-20]|nr:MAG: hypothetical protein BGO17_03845 [Candidatus Saccharibacteria bacterium 49-20]